MKGQRQILPPQIRGNSPFSSVLEITASNITTCRTGSDSHVRMNNYKTWGKPTAWENQEPISTRLVLRWYDWDSVCTRGAGNSREAGKGGNCYTQHAKGCKSFGTRLSLWPASFSLTFIVGVCSESHRGLSHSLAPPARKVSSIFSSLAKPSFLRR